MTAPIELDAALKPLLPLTAGVNAAGHLAIGGCDTVDLAAIYGTPLYVFDEADLHARCREIQAAFDARLPDVGILYASKAYLGKALGRLVAEEGLGIDVVSGGEIALAAAAGFPLERAYFHGNNKTHAELEEAVAAGVGRVVIDNFRDIELLNAVALAAGRRQAVLLRITPDVDPHTHSHISTGVLDSKFGLPLAGGRAEAAAMEALAAPGLDVVGVHCHIGSQIFETEPYAEAIGKVIAFAAGLAKEHGLDLREFSPGGGIGLQYVRDQAPPPVDTYAEAIATAVRAGCEQFGLRLPRVLIEPGRSLVGRAGVALYRVGSRKDVPGVRAYVAVDGGMADNIRPAIYGSLYEAVAAGRPGAPVEETVTVVGKYCESGDVLIRDARLPRLEADEVLAIPAAGAYCLAMASNYNAALKPAVVFVSNGEARLVRRRETYADLLACEVD